MILLMYYTSKDDYEIMVLTKKERERSLYHMPKYLFYKFSQCGNVQK